jgi:branched-subunit amino acid permease
MFFPCDNGHAQERSLFGPLLNTVEAGDLWAALFGFCLALVAYSLLAVVLAALHGVHSEEIRDEEVSLYDIGNEIATIYHGMMIAIPAPERDILYSMSPADLAAILLELAQGVS